MYKVVVQLFDLNSHGNPVIHEVHSIHKASIQEAFESIETGKELFETYLACEQDIMKSINELNNQ